MTPESELLLACARPRADAAALREAASRQTDWARWLDLAGWHGLKPLAYWQLEQACPEAVPPETLRALGAGFRASAEHCLRLTGELLEVLPLFEAAGLSAVPFKGPVLAWWIYGHPALREFSDLDILVRPEDVPRAREVLAARGYRPLVALDGPLERTFLRWLGQMPFYCEDRRAVVDLHWSLAPPSFGLRLESAGRVRVQIGSRQISTFGAEDALLLLAFHGAKHGWVGLSIFCDVATLMARVPIDWEGVLARAGEQRLLRRLLVALCVVEELLGAELGAPVQARIRADRRVRELAAQARAWVLGPPQMTDGNRFQFRAMDRFWDGLWVWLGSVFQPTEADWTAWRIPPSLFPLYYLARPVRLILKHGLLQARRLFRRPQ